LEEVSVHPSRPSHKRHYPVETTGLRALECRAKTEQVRRSFVHKFGEHGMEVRVSDVNCYRNYRHEVIGSFHRYIMLMQICRVFPSIGPNREQPSIKRNFCNSVQRFEACFRRKWIQMTYCFILF
jgi:hypothetical protein